MKLIKQVYELEKDELERLYKVFDFEEYEIIESASMCTDGWYKIYFNNIKNKTYCEYKPYLNPEIAEDCAKQDYIINGTRYPEYHLE